MSSLAQCQKQADAEQIVDFHCGIGKALAKVDASICTKFHSNVS